MLSPLVMRQLESRYGWPGEFAEQVYPYYVATLRNLATGRPTPVYQVVDDMWHAHILCTRDYADFCTREFGCFIHHEPWEDERADVPDGAGFLAAFGLSLRGLTAICEELFRGMPGDRDGRFQLAKCGQPKPQRLARCGQDEPRRPTAGGVPTERGVPNQPR